MERPQPGERPAKRVSTKSKEPKEPKEPRAERVRATARRDKSDPIDAVPQEAQPIFQSLRTLRTEIAREEQVPPYVVFDNKTLYQIAVHRPRTIAALQALHGIGPVKAEKYGPRFIAALSNSHNS